MIQQKWKHSWIGPYLGADLVAALASLDVDNFTHVVALGWSFGWQRKISHKRVADERGDKNWWWWRVKAETPGRKRERRHEATQTTSDAEVSVAFATFAAFISRLLSGSSARSGKVQKLAVTDSNTAAATMLGWVEACALELPA